MGIAPTWKKMEVRNILIVKIVAGSFSEAWVKVDNLGMTQQIGALPEV
jgi:hypothetical protein